MKLNVTDVGFITEEPLSLSDYGSELDKLLGQYEIKGRNMADRENPVSYTHLTLPTIYSV